MSRWVAGVAFGTGLEWGLNSEISASEHGLQRACSNVRDSHGHAGPWLEKEGSDRAPRVRASGCFGAEEVC